MRPKPAYFSIKRELDTVTVGIQRTVQKNRDNDRPRQFYECTSVRALKLHRAANERVRLKSIMRSFRRGVSDHERDYGRMGDQQLRLDRQMPPRDCRL